METETEAETERGNSRRGMKAAVKTTTDVVGEGEEDRAAAAAAAEVASVASVRDKRKLLKCCRIYEYLFVRPFVSCICRADEQTGKAHRQTEGRRDGETTDGETSGNCVEVH